MSPVARPPTQPTELMSYYLRNRRQTRKDNLMKQLKAAEQDPLCRRPYIDQPSSRADPPTPRPAKCSTQHHASLKATLQPLKENSIMNNLKASSKAAPIHESQDTPTDEPPIERKAAQQQSWKHYYASAIATAQPVRMTEERSRRLTIDLPCSLHRELKVYCAQENLLIGRFVCALVTAGLKGLKESEMKEKH